MLKNKIFVGPGNIAGNAMYVAKALRKAGINAKSFSYRAHPFGYSCDFDKILFNNPIPEPEKRSLVQKIVVNKHTLKFIWTIQKLVLFTSSLIWYDTFIFISHETFLSNNKDLPVLKLFRKRIAFLFVGCPERDTDDIINQTDRGICSFCSDTRMQLNLHCYSGQNKRNKIEYISNFGNIIFSHRDTASFIIDKQKIKAFYCTTDMGLNKEAILNKFTSGEELVIAHLPSNSLLKGTESVLKSIDDLRSKGYQFRFISDRVKNSEISFLLKKTHILIDQFSVGHGLLGVEGMANGCIVICRTAKWFKEDFPELPLVSCNPEELTDVLINLISDRQKMLNIALKSHEYFNKYHTPEAVGIYYRNILKLT